MPWETRINQKILFPTRNIARWLLIDSPGQTLLPSLSIIMFLAARYMLLPTVSKITVRARLGINLGPLPIHAGSVTLVLSLLTGLISPHFHVHCDNLFETVRPYEGNGPTFYRWQVISGLKSRVVQSTEVLVLQDAPNHILPYNTELLLPKDAPPPASDRSMRDQDNSVSTEPPDKIAD